MKLHLPVKLRASLIAAVIAVGASVYNAYGAHTYKGSYGENDFVFPDTPAPVAGNQYTAVTAYAYNVDDSGTPKVVAKAENGKWYIVDPGTKKLTTTEWTGTVDESEANIAFTDTGDVTFSISGSGTNPTMVFQGNTEITADNVTFKNSVTTPEDAEKTTITAKGELAIDAPSVFGTDVVLKNVDIEAGSTTIDTYASLSIDNSKDDAPANGLDLGAVTGEGSLSITGGKYDVSGEQKNTKVEMDKLDLNNMGKLTLDTTDAAIIGDVKVNGLSLTNSVTKVGGSVTAFGNVSVSEGSTLAAVGSVKTNLNGTGSIAIAGEVSSKEGEIVLDNGTISGSVITESATAGNVTIKNVTVKDGAKIDSAADLTLTGNTVIIDTPNDNGTPDDTSDDNKSITVNVDGDLTVEDDSVVDNVKATVVGAITVDNATVKDSEITGATGDITVDNGGKIAGTTITGTMGAITVDNGGKIDGSIITGATGDITITGGEGSDVTNTLINGGRHFELNSGMNDVTLAGTKIINLTGDIKLDGTNRTGLELSTKGISDVTGYDNLVGGSILIENSTLADSTIKSGVVTTIADDGTLSYSDVANPNGQVKVAGSTLTNVVATTKNGPIGITSSDITGSTVTTGNGNMTIGGAVSTSLTDPAKSIGLNNSQSQANTNKIRFTKGFGYLGAGDKINSIKVEEWGGGTVQTGVVATLKKNGVVVAVSKPVNLTGTNNNMVAFEFDYPVAIEPAATDYTLEFNKEVRIRLYDANDAIVQYGDNNQNWSSKVIIGSTDFDTNLLGSTVATNGGQLEMNGTYTAAAGDKDTSIKATGNSTITNSLLDGGTNVEITGGDLTITNSALVKDVNVSVKNTMTISGETVVDIDGGDDHDASVKAGNLNAGGETAVAGDTINIKNADVQVGGFTTIYKNGTLNLTDVYAEGETASKLGYLKADGEDEARGKLNIDSSIIEISGIRAGGDEDTTHFTGAADDSLSRYFGTVNVSGASDVKVTEGKALIDKLNVKGGSTVSLKKAYLNTTTIDGTSTVETVGISKLDDVNIANGGTIRVTNTGDGATTLANLNRVDADTTGTVKVEVVNATLETPEVNERVVLGLSGGTLELKSVAAHGTALAGSVAPVTEHVKLAGVTNAGVDNLKPGESTIKTAGLNRLQSYASGTEGTRVTADNLYRYLYTVKDAYTVQEGDALYVKDTAGNWTLAAAGASLTPGMEVSKLNYTQTEAEKQYDGTVADPNLSAVTMVDATLSLAEQAYLEPQKVTTWAENVTQVTETVNGILVTYYQKVEKMDPIDYIDGYAKHAGSVEVMHNGIASLTVNGDFGANQAVINSYRLAEPVLYWKGGVAMTVDQYKALSDADKAACTPEYKGPGDTKVYYTISNTAFSGMTSDGTLSATDKNVYTQLKSIYTGTIGDDTRDELVEGDADKFKYDRNGTYTRTIDTQQAYNELADKTGWVGNAANTYTKTIDQAAFNGLTAEEQANCTANAEGGYTWTINQAAFNGLTDTTDWTGAADNTFTHTIGDDVRDTLDNKDAYVYNRDGSYTSVKIDQTAYDALLPDDKAQCVANADGSYTLSITKDVYDSLVNKMGLGENERWYTTITEEAYADIADADKKHWFGETIQSDRDGVGLTNTFVDADGKHYTSDDTGYIKIQDDLSGSNNVFNADDTIAVGSISGSNNKLTAVESITTGDITGNTNTLQATGIIKTGTITGSENELFTAESITADAITGGTNKLTSAESITINGAIEGAGNNLMASESITTGAITGSGNELEAGTTLNVESIGGADNKLSAESITTNAITGNGNTLEANGDVTVNGAVAGGNTITSATGNIKTGDITDDGNELNAPGTIETGAITSSNNKLLDAETISTGAITGNGNELTGGVVTVNGKLQGSNNALTANTGDVTLDSSGGYSIDGSGNAITATGDVNIEDNVKGNNNTIKGTNILSHVENGNVWAGIEGNSNQLLADAEILMDTIAGSSNTLEAGTSIKTSAITGSNNTLEAGTSITSGAITGSSNTLEAGTSITSGAIKGSNNTLIANDGDISLDYVWNADSNGYASIVGSYNTIDATGTVNVKDDIVGNNNIIGGENIISNGGDDPWASLKGNENQLQASDTIRMDTVEGNKNKLTAGSLIKLDGLSGNENELISDTITTGAISGSSNTFRADTITTGAIAGNSNELSGESINTQGITGDRNELYAESITTGGINGTTNKLVGQTVNVNGKLEGSANKVTANTIHVNELAGTAQKIISTGVDKAADTAISIGTLTATDTTIEVLYPNSGSISIDKMSSKAATGETGTTITALAGNVTIGTLDDVTSKTSIKVGDLYGISVGSGTASNQTWVGGSLAITGPAGIALTNSTVKMLGDITGTSLSLAANAKGYTSSANNVSLSGNLVLSGNASLNITGDVESGTLSLSDSSWLKAGEVTTDTLTLVGDGVALDITKLTVNKLLDLQAGASLDGVKVNTDADGAALKVTDSTLTSGMLSGFTGVTLDNSVGNLGSSSLTGMTNDVAAVRGSTLIVTSIGTKADVLADNSAITATAGISADNVTAQKKGTITTQGGNIVAKGTVTADNGEIKTNGGDITAGSMVITKGGEISADDVILTGTLNAAGGTLEADSVSGATIAQLNGATIAGVLSMADVVAADVTATNGTKIGSIAKADAVTLTASSVTGNVGMNGDLNMGAEATIGGAVTGATNATLNNADITGTLGMGGKLNMTDASTGAVTGATDATLTDSIITGTLGMGGELNMTNASTGAVTGATSATLDNASITGALGMGGELNMTNASADSVTGATNATLDNASITGALGMGGELNMTAASAGSVTGATDATLTDATIDGALNASGTVEVDGGSIGSITGSATTVDLDNVESIGSITMSTNGTLNVADTVTGAVNAANGNTVANATLIDSMIGSGLNVTDTLDVIGDAGVAGNVTAGNLNVSDGMLYATDGNTLYDVTVNNKTTLSNGEVVAGTFTTKELELVDMAGEVEKLIAAGNVAMAGTSLDVTKTDADAVKVGGSMTLTQGAMLTNAGGAQITGDLKVDGSAFTNEGAVQAGSIAVKDGGVLTGTTVTANGVTVTSGGTLAGVVTSTGDVTVSNGSITGDVTSISGDVTATGSTIGGDVAATNVKLTNGSTAGDVFAEGSVELAGSTAGDVAAAGSVTLSGSTAGDVAADGSVKLTNGSTAGDVAAEGSVTLAGSTAGDVAAEGSVTLAGSTAGDVAAAGSVELAGSIAGNVITDGSVKLTDATVGAVEADAATLTHSTINGALTAGDTVVSSDVVVKGSADVDGLTVNKVSSLIAADVTADGELDIQGAVMTTTGNVALTGAEGSTIAADVTAAGDVIISGTVAATEAAIKGANVIIEGTLAATEAAIKGANVTIDGTLAAGKGVSFIGTVGGAGTIVKTGGDTLALAGDTKIGGVTVKGSKLAVDGGADLGKLTVSDKSTVEIAGEGMGTVKVAAGSSIKDSVVNVDLSLNAKTRTAINGDVIDGSVDMSGTTVVLRADIDESSVKDLDSYKLVTGTVKGDYTVKHELDTLNVHAEGGEIVFSKNYKSAEYENGNQSATAEALFSVTTPAGELAGVMEALAHTRSEAEALAAIDSLGGVGLTAAPKLVADETKEHLQTLRSTLQSVSAGLERRYTASGLRLDSIESSGVTAAVTGGSSTVKEDSNAPEYSRNSIGAMFAAAHAINDEWVFGAAISFSKGDADCGYTTLESQGVFLDVGVMQKRGRFSQMGSIGCAFFNMDTERTVGVNAFGGTAEGSTSASAVTVSYETSYAIWQTESYSVSSVIMGEAVFAQIDNMEEEGLGNAGLRSSFDDVASFTFGAGARYTYHFGEETNPGYFSLEALFVADTGDSTMKVNNTFIGGGNSFQLSGPEAGNYGLRLNAGVLVPLGDQWGLFGNATGEIRSEQTTVGGSVGIKCTF